MNSRPYIIDPRAELTGNPIIGRQLSETPVQATAQRSRASNLLADRSGLEVDFWLTTTAGLAGVNVIGGWVKQYSVTPDPQRLAAAA